MFTSVSQHFLDRQFLEVNGLFITADADEIFGPEVKVQEVTVQDLTVQEVP
jgi:hypothetical protein